MVHSRVHPSTLLHPTQTTPGTWWKEEATCCLFRYLVMGGKQDTERERERGDELFQGWDEALSAAAGQRKLEGNQERKTPLDCFELCQSPKCSGD